MKLLWIVPACIAFSLSAQSDLATALSRVQGLSLDQIRELQARVAAEEGTLEQKAYEDAYLNYCVASRFSSKEAKQAEILIDRERQIDPAIPLAADVDIAVGHRSDAPRIRPRGHAREKTA